MRFTVEAIVNNHCQIIDTINADTHAEALRIFRNGPGFASSPYYPAPEPQNAPMLRDWQHYRLTEDSLSDCHSLTWIANFHCVSEVKMEPGL